MVRGAQRTKPSGVPQRPAPGEGITRSGGVAPTPQLHPLPSLAPIDGRDSRRAKAPDSGGLPSVGAATGNGVGPQALAFAKVEPPPTDAARTAAIDDQLDTASDAVETMWAVLSGLAEMGVGQAKFGEQRVADLCTLFDEQTDAALPHLEALRAATDLAPEQGARCSSLSQRFASLLKMRLSMQV